MLRSSSSCAKRDARPPKWTRFACHILNFTDRAVLTVLSCDRKRRRCPMRNTLANGAQPARVAAPLTGRTGRDRFGHHEPAHHQMPGRHRGVRRSRGRHKPCRLGSGAELKARSSELERGRRCAEGATRCRCPPTKEAQATVVVAADDWHDFLKIFLHRAYSHSTVQRP